MHSQGGIKDDLEHANAHDSTPSDALLIQQLSGLLKAIVMWLHPVDDARFPCKILCFHRRILRH